MAGDADKQALDVLMKEFELMSREIVERVRIQKEVERSQVLLVVGVVAAAKWIWESQSFQLLLMSSAMLFIMGIAFFEQDINIAIIAGYINRIIRRRVAKHVRNGKSDGVIDWERFRHREFLRTDLATILTLNRSLLTYLPGFAALGTYCYLKYSLHLLHERWDEGEVVLLVLNLVLAALLISVGRRVPRLYNEITRSN